MDTAFGFLGPRDDATLAAMDAQLTHRGPRASSVFGDHGSVGYRTYYDSDRQADFGPGIAQREDLLMVFAGTLYGDARRAFAADAGRSTADQILAAFAAEGVALLTRLTGCWTLAIVTPDRVHLARDGVGARTLCWGRHGGRVLFASESKALWSLPGFPRRLSPAAVARYLTFSFQPGAPTMLEDIFELPAGHMVTVPRDGEPEIHRFFHFERTADDEPRATEDWVTLFRATHRQAVADRLVPGEPVAATLSGGIDSSVVVAELAEQVDRVRTVAIHFGKNYPNELEHARAVAERCGTEHEEVLIRPRGFLPRLREIIWHLDDPIGDPVTVPNFEIAAHLAKNHRFVFNGEGGDPSFGGPKNLTMMLHHWYGGLDRGPNFRERMYLASYRRAYEELDHLLHPEWRQAIDHDRDLGGILTPFFAAEQPEGFLDKLMAINLRLKGAHLILPKVERMQGTWGITPLAPLFDERLVRMSFAMPAQLKVASGIEKVILKRAYADALPASIVERPKSGMRVPVHYWCKGEMRRYARKILSRKNVARVGIFDPDRVQQLLRYDTGEGPGRYGLRLWMLITFEIWRRIVIDGEPV